MILKLLSRFGFLIFLVTSWTIIICTTIPLLPFSMTILITRKLEEIVYRILYRALHFKTEETPWLTDTPRNRTDINCLLMLEGKLGIKKFQGLMDRKLVKARNTKTGKLLYPRVTEYVHTGYLNYYWLEETNFKLKDHVYEWSENPCRSKNQLQDLISKLAERPLRSSDNKSPWEFVVVHCRNTDGFIQSGIIVRISHCLADGTSLMYFLINHLCDDSNNNGYLAGPEHQISFTQKSMIYLKSSIYYPYNVAKTLAPQWTRPTSLNCPEASLSGKKRYIYARPINLELIKIIKRNLNVTINDVILGCIATSLHNFFRKKNEKAPHNLITCIPLDTRLSLEQAKEFSNKINITMLPLPTSSADSIRNILEIHDRMKSRKDSLEGMSMRIGLRLLAEMTPNCAMQEIIRSSASNAVMIVSNVQGPSHELMLAGNKLSSLVFWPPGKDSIGSSISIMSYNGFIYTGALSDTNIMKYPEKMIEDLPAIIMSLAESFTSKKNAYSSD
ncbi:probable diacyglycerol O-acyltransferase tgs1 [Clytia hemisphaerica]|uniref:Diacylglycerol O-acyltransferase n=1 Tax=Clytia hemisphaerica TaxID=252671 RepID=A0A7M5WW05_9CNID|eukprot:TCONS_00011988-protein